MSCQLLIESAKLFKCWVAQRGEMANYEVRKILESREVKDEQGRIKGRQFLVLWKQENDPTWEPLENLVSFKKVLKSFYNKHPELPYPNFLAVNDDEEFDPSQSLGINKKQPGSKPLQQIRGRLPKQSLDYSPAKQKGRPSMNTPQKAMKMSQSEQPRAAEVPVFAGMAEEKQQGKHKVLGLYVQSSTNQIVFYVQSEGVCSFRNRKWIIENCIQSLAEFYENCMVVTPTQN